MSPSLGRGIGTTYLPAASAKAGTQFKVECRGEKVPADGGDEAVLEKGISEEGGRVRQRRMARRQGVT